MNTAETHSVRSLRLWPGVVAALLLALVRFGAPLVSSASSAGLVALLGGFVGAAAIVIWWAFFSRAPLVERWGAVGLMVVALAATPRLLHHSVAMGNLGFQYFIYAVPTLSLALVVWAVASRHRAPGPRRISMVAAMPIGST